MTDSQVSSEDVKDKDEVAQESKKTEEPAFDWKSLARKWEDRAKANKSELEQTEAERAKDLERIAALEEAEKKLREENETLLKEAVAAAKGVPAKRIFGATREELEADADRFLEDLKAFPQRGYVPTAGQGGDEPEVSVMSGRERAREALGKS